MNRPLSRLATRAAYGASQLPRIAWYLGHGLAMTRIAQRARESGSARPRPHTDAPIPLDLTVERSLSSKVVRTTVANATRKKLNPTEEFVVGCHGKHRELAALLRTTKGLTAEEMTRLARTAQKAKDK
jgi:hypothetical protein